MIVLRAVFWIPVVALLAPSVPELGIPRGDNAGGDLIYSVQEKALQTLARVKADIQAQRRLEGAREVAQTEFEPETALRSDLAREPWRRPSSPP